MKYVLMNSNNNPKKVKKVVPVDIKEKTIKLKKNENSGEEGVAEEAPEKEVDIAEFNIPDNEFSRELKKRTDSVLKAYLKANPPIALTYLGFDKDMNAVVEGVLNDQDIKKKQHKKDKRAEKMRTIKNKIFKRGKNG